MRRLLLLVILATTGLAASSPSAGAQAKDQGDCKPLSLPQTRVVTIPYRFQETRQRKGTNTETGGPWPVQVRRQKDGVAGTVTFKAAACRIGNRKWKLASPQTLSYRSAGVRTDQGGVIDTELRIGLADATEGPVSLISMRVLSCRRAIFRTSLKYLIGAIPLKRLNPADGLVDWLVAKGVGNDKLKCVDWGTVNLNAAVGPSGKVRVGTDSTNTIPYEYERPGKTFRQAWTYTIPRPTVERR